MKKIIFDLSFVTDSIFTGVGIYAYRILLYIVKTNRQSNYILLLNYKSANDIRKMFPDFEYRIMGPQWMSGSRRFNSHLNMLCFKYTVSKIDSNLIFCPYGGVYCCLSTGKKKIVTLHDLQVRLDPNQHTKREVQNVVFAENHHIKNSDYIFTISEFSRQQILQFYPEVEPRLLNMGNLVVTPNVENVLPMKPGYNYILYVGRLCEMKNVMTLIRAFNIIKEQKNNFRLVLLSHTDGYWFSTILPYIIENKFEDKVVFVKSCSEKDLYRWYLGASLFVFPSLREGFGAPPIEAALMKIPVITSKADSLEEVTMGLLNYYEPIKDERALAKTINKVLDNPPTDEELSSVKKVYAEKYSIDNVAKHIIDFVEKMNNDLKINRK